MNPDGNGEISNEFFKKLNQQIVQKDNLIKLLQLQIRNLKNQIDSGGAGAEDSAEMKKALEEKSLEVEKFQAELQDQKSQFDLFSNEKEEQIQALSKLLEDHQATGESSGEILEDPRVPELEAQIQALTLEVEAAKTSIAVPVDETEIVQQLRISSEAAKAELQQAEIAMSQFSQQLEEKDVKIAQLELAAKDPVDYPTAAGKVMELEQDIETLRNLLAEKEEAIAAGASGEPAVDPQTLAQLADAQAEIEVLKSRITDIQNNPSVPANVEEEINKLREENAQISELKQKLEILQTESESMAETAMKVTALESEREQLANELENLKNSGESEAEQSLKLELTQLRETLQQRDDELARLRVSIESRQDESMADPVIREEVEELTRQVADQLLAIQNFEGMLNKAKDQLESKNIEVEALKANFSQTSTPQAVIPIAGDSEIIGSFIDFFDGLDSLLTRNPLPELQALHQKLLERLIIPNQIAYMPVISEQFDENRHIATDYFRSEKFPERCVVFEVEKGYSKADTMIKKSKVWVVQNLFDCQECNSTQGNPDSKFCHMCGAKMVAPNGLPIDSLPEFEPTPATYQRFAERMISKGQLEEAKQYLHAGLELDQNYVPLMIKLGEILSSESKYEEALELFKKSINLKQDVQIQEKIQDIEVKLNIFKQAQSLKLDPEEFSKLVNLIQK